MDNIRAWKLLGRVENLVSAEKLTAMAFNSRHREAIEQMAREVMTDPEYRHLQKILFEFDKEKKGKKKLKRTRKTVPLEGQTSLFA